MAMTTEEIGDRVELNDMVSRYGTLIDNRDWAALDLIFDVDIEFDMTDISRGVIRGLEPLKIYMDTDAIHPVAHIVTNVYAQELSRDRAKMCSRLLAVQTDGTVIVGKYVDDAVRAADGWRITRRVFTYTRRSRSDR